MTETHTPYQRGRRAAERGCSRVVPNDLPLTVINHLRGPIEGPAWEWLEGYDSVPVVSPSVGIRVIQLPHAEGLPLPEYATAGAAGMDLVAAYSDLERRHLLPGMRLCIPTGLSIALPPGYELQIRSRSGLALKNGVTVLNAPGTIDEDYRGEIGVILINHGHEPLVIERGMKIAQAVLAPVTRAHWVPVDTLDDTVRGCGGFGSTGT